MSTGPERLADALTETYGDPGADQWRQGVVTALAGVAVTVDVGGGSLLTVPRLASYSAPAVGDVVWLAGPPGSWFCLGALAR